MRAIAAAIVALGVLYMADQEFADGRYTNVTMKIVKDIRRSVGF